RMLLRILFLSMLLVNHLVFIGCSSIDESPSEQQEQNFAEDDEFADDSSEGDDEVADEESDEEASDEVADNEDTGEDFYDESEEDQSDEVADDQFNDDSEGLQEDQPTEEESLADQAQELSEEPQQGPQQEVQQESAVEDLSAPAMASSQSTAVNIENIKFLSNERGGTIVVETSMPSQYTTRFNEANNQMILEIPNSTLPNRLTRPIITNEFQNGKFSGVNAYQNPGGNVSRIVVQLKGTDRPFVSSEGKAIYIIPAGGGTESVAEISEVENRVYSDADKESYDVEAARKDTLQALKAQSLDDFLVNTNVFYGRKISLETGKDADVRDVLNFIGEQSGANMVISDGVDGKIQLKIKDIPWDQALMLVLKSKKLGYIRQGNVIRIATLSELEQEAQASSRVKESRSTLAPIYLKVVPISYASVKDLSSQVKAFMTSERSSVVADERTSSLILKDTQEGIDKALRLIKELDKPPSQVMIQGKIVEASSNFSRNLSRNFDFTGLFGSNKASFSSGQGEIKTVGKLGIGLQLGANTINALLGAEERLDHLKVISSPRVVTLNNAEATIEQKGELVTVETKTSAEGGVLTSSPNVRAYTLTLKVKPQITSDGGVLMDVDVKREFPGAQVAGTSYRPINSRSAKTKTMVKNGQTAIIGGVFENTKLEAEAGLTYMKDIPILGWLLKGNTRDETKNELVIFLTPQILEDDY
ncbi:MAG: AMIN domain-containing protein, partial [Bdellovibrionales bacterium]|nr:AMIN domain-containing protein [Bdellovibrionales bacterium]